MCGGGYTCSSRAGPRAAGAWKKAAWYGIGNSMCRIESLNYTSLLRMSIICSWVGRSRPEKHRWHVFSLLTSQLLRGQGPLRGGRWVPFSAPCFRQLLFGHAFGPAFGAGDSLIPVSTSRVYRYPALIHAAARKAQSTSLNLGPLLDCSQMSLPYSSQRFPHRAFHPHTVPSLRLSRLSC